MLCLWCTAYLQEYGDVSSAMGLAGPLRCFNAPQLWSLGWTNTSIVLDTSNLNPGMPMLLRACPYVHLPDLGTMYCKSGWQRAECVCVCVYHGESVTLLGFWIKPLAYPSLRCNRECWLEGMRLPTSAAGRRDEVRPSTVSSSRRTHLAMMHRSLKFGFEGKEQPACTRERSARLCLQR